VDLQRITLGMPLPKNAVRQLPCNTGCELTFGILFRPPIDEERFWKGLIMIRELSAVAVMFVLAGSAAAEHIPGHNNNDPIFPVPIPGRQVFDGGILFVTALGPFGGSEITDTEFDITFVSDGATPASDMVIYVSYFSAAGFLDFHLTGADLGFGAGPGTFIGSLSTDALNGTTVESFPPPYSQINLEIGAVTGQIDGVAYFEDSFINFYVPEPGVGVLLALGLVLLSVINVRRRG
jgi:hypothetical protein